MGDCQGESQERMGEISKRGYGGDVQGYHTH